jgi:aldehyde dehydrogenase (NAD+)
MQLQNKLFIAGEFVDAEARGRIEVFNPHDNSKIADVAEAREIDIDKAVAAATKAFPAWRGIAAADRGRLLLKLADAIEARAEELAHVESIDTGHPIRDTRMLDVPRTAATFRYFGGMADKLQGGLVPVDPGFLNYIEHEPLGVVGQVVPWNFPIMFTSWKMGPALAAGNCVVMKPAELTPLSSLKVAELMREVGFPPGVVNILPGYGNVAGQYLAEHPQVQKIAFTGSTATGRRIVQASRATSSASSSSSAARAQISCSTTPTSRRRSTAARSRSFITRARLVSRARACCCTKASRINFSTVS